VGVTRYVDGAVGGQQNKRITSSVVDRVPLDGRSIMVLASVSVVISMDTKTPWISMNTSEEGWGRRNTIGSGLHQRSP
jgi:hypothetical protein